MQELCNSLRMLKVTYRKELMTSYKQMIYSSFYRPSVKYQVNFQVYLFHISISYLFNDYFIQIFHAHQDNYSGIGLSSQMHVPGKFTRFCSPGNNPKTIRDPSMS